MRTSEPSQRALVTPGPSVRRYAIEAGCSWQSATHAETHERAVAVDGEDAHGTAGGVERIQEVAVRAHRDVEICRTRRIRSDHRRTDGSERTVGPDFEARNRVRPGVRGVDESAIGSHDVPADCGAQSR